MSGCVAIKGCEEGSHPVTKEWGDVSLQRLKIFPRALSESTLWSYQ
jgi:hypothetical protein